MIRYRYKKAKLLFVGINPHHGSYRRGVPFSNNKTFWYLLARAGLLKEKMEDLRSDVYLQKMYREKFNTVYGLGLVNMVDRPSRDVTELMHGEETAGKKRLLKVVRSEQPRVICFIGKVSYEKYAGRKDFDFGWQNDIQGSRAFVMHFPLRGEADVRVRELRTVARAASVAQIV